MPYDEEKVRRHIRNGTDPKYRPTLQQVQAISSLTYDSGAVEIMKRMLRRRLDPKAYVVPETEHTLLMLRNCLATASQDFVAYVRKDLAPLIAQFYRKGNTGGDLGGIHDAAGSLLHALRADILTEEGHSHIRVRTNSVQNQGKRDARDSKGGSTVSTVSEAFPMTPPDTPSSILSQALQRTADRKATDPSEFTTVLSSTGYAGLPTPRGSPAEEKARLTFESDRTPLGTILEIHTEEIKDKIRAMTSNTPPPITTAQLEAAVEMTYDPTELDVVQKVIDTRLDALKSQQTYHHLVKTLTLVHHLLFHASDDFVEFCRQRKGVFEKLCNLRCPNHDVRSRAEAILDRVKDDKRLQKERQSRKAMRTPRRASSSVRRISDYTVPATTPPPGTVNRRQSLIESASTTPIVQKIGDYALGRGGYSDVWKGKLTLDDGATFTLVAVKVLRLTSRATEPERLRKRLEREVRVWRRLEHESIAEFYGVVYDTNQSPAIISPWYERGSADAYLRNYPDADPMKLLWEIVLGVEYLHDNNVVHGDLKGGNVMVDGKGHAKLIDFGLSRLIDSVAGPGLTTSSVSFSIRWCAPELVQSDDSSTTKASDVYAFASTALELLTGEVPYQSLKERSVIMAVTKGVTPKRPDNSSNHLSRCPEQVWELLESCWKQASLRPSISEVKTQMRTFYN